MSEEIIILLAFLAIDFAGTVIDIYLRVKKHA